MDAELSKYRDLISQGEALYSVGKYDDALEFFERAMQEEPMNIQAYICAAQANIFKDEYDKARDWLKKAILVDKNDAVTYFHMGNVEMLDGNREAARENYAKAIGLGYDGVQIYINMAADAEERSDYEEAIRYYDRLLALDKFNAYAKTRKIQVYLIQNKLPEALVACDSMIETNPDLIDAYHYKFAILLDMGKENEAENVLNTAAAMFPDNEALAFDKATLLESKGESAKAVEMLNTLKITPENERIINSKKAGIYLAAGQYKDAQALLEPFFEKTHDGEAAYFLTAIYMAEKEYDKAIKTSEVVVEARERSDYYYAALYFHAMAMKKAGKEGTAEAINEANQVFRAACVANPGQVQFYLYRAMCHKELREFEAAMEMLDYITKVAPDLAEGFYLRSLIYKELNQTEKAEEDRAKALSLKPEIEELLGA